MRGVELGWQLRLVSGRFDLNEFNLNLLVLDYDALCPAPFCYLNRVCIIDIVTLSRCLFLQSAVVYCPFGCCSDYFEEFLVVVVCSVLGLSLSAFG
jgi:hypothetical protein